MIRTICSIFVTLGIIFGVSVFEIRYVNDTFGQLHAMLQAVYQKTEANVAVYEDCEAVRTFWRTKKKVLHAWLPHTALQEVDYQLDEAAGLMYVQDYQNALPKLEVLLGLSESVPAYCALDWQNIL